MSHDSSMEAVDLTGQVAIVTGAGRGLGRAFSRALAAAGAKVAVISRTGDQLAKTARMIRDQGGVAFPIPTDVSNRRAVEQMAEQVMRELGPVDLLVNNAGVNGPIGPVWESNPEEWWRCVEINLRGPYLCSRIVLPAMLARGRGRIINVSGGARTAIVPYLTPYVTSKTALTRLSETMDAETHEHGVSVFAIDPGVVRTTMTEQAVSSPSGRKWIPWFREIFESGEDVTPEHVAQLVVWLASGKADALAGRLIRRGENLQKLLEHAQEIRERELYTLSLNCLPLQE